MTKVYSSINGKEVEKIQEKKNYDSIDLFKFIFSFFVITLHTGLFAFANDELEFWFLNTVSKLAVPFFFACSGFLFLGRLDYKNDKIENSSKNRKKFFKYIWRMFLLYMIWSAIYLIYVIPSWNENGWLSFGIFKDYLISTFRVFSYYHLWYVIDLIYATILSYIILNFIKRKYVIYIAVVLYLIGAISYGYFSVQLPFANLINSIKVFSEAVFNAIFRAFPFIFMGYYFGTHKIKLKKNVILLIISLISLVAEIYLLRNFTANTFGFSYIIFTLPCCCLIFSLILKINVNIKTETLKFLRNMSTVIYCFHPLVLGVLLSLVAIESMNSLIICTVVTGVSVAVAFIIVKLSQFKYLRFLKYLY